MKAVTKLNSELRGGLIVSCQAPEGSPFRDPASMAHFAQAAVQGGAAGIRANGGEDVRAIRQVVRVPIIGISKRVQQDGEILITPSWEAAQELVGAGADMIALDCTQRGQRYGALQRLRRIKEELGVPVLADIATREEAVQAAQAGADAVLSTLRGYTEDTRQVLACDPRFIAELVRELEVPVIAEGRIHLPQQALALFEAGAFAVVVGTAITQPEAISRGFVAALQAGRRQSDPQSVFVGIDMGGTRTKYGLVTGEGKLLFSASTATPWDKGREGLLEHLKQTAGTILQEARRLGIAPAALGLATAGWVDPRSGEVVYATDNLPGWTGASPGTALHEASGLPVAVENDANALAVAEKHFGAAKAETDFVCITLGTGVGGGCYVAGRLNRGSHFFANAIGHVPIDPEGPPCTCGLAGCLETYTNAAALLRYGARGNFASSEELIAAAHRGDPVGRDAVMTLAKYLAVGCSGIIHLLDPDVLILGGGLAQNNPLLFSSLFENLSRHTTAWQRRKLRVMPSPLGYSAGVLGAAAVAANSLASSGYEST